MAYVVIIRPLNGIMVFVSVLFGYWAARGAGAPLSALMLLEAGLAAFFIAAYGNVINDIFDVDTDTVVKPRRPIPSGRMTRAQASRYSAALLVLGLVCARAASAVHFYSAFIVALLLWLYSFRLKGTMLAGNIAVAGFLGYTIVYGGLISRNWKAALVPAAFAFLINLAREIIKDTADRRGDAQSGIRTFPVQYGERPALRLSVFCLAVLVLATFAPYLCGMYSRLYLIIILAGVNAPLAVMAIILLKKSPGEAALNRISGLLKLVMAAGMAAIILGKAGPACAYAFSV